MSSGCEAGATLDHGEPLGPEAKDLADRLAALEPEDEEARSFRYIVLYFDIYIIDQVFCSKEFIGYMSFCVASVAFLAFYTLLCPFMKLLDATLSAPRRGFRWY